MQTEEESQNGRMPDEGRKVSMICTGRGVGASKWNIKIFYEDSSTEYLDGFSTENAAVDEARRLRKLHGLDTTGSTPPANPLALDLALAQSRRDEGISS